ncbi:MAG: hypothetical protein QNJ31_03870 [Candidatus Caenarcaniphilales bacterium]|nr:hypothetical protein [Candidatus Caenarcaniphilales bacterium]
MVSPVSQLNSQRNNVHKLSTGSSSAARNTPNTSKMKLSKGMVKSEPFVIGASLSIPLIGYLLGQINQDSDNKILQPSFLTPLSNILLSLFAAIGYQSSMPIAGLGNYLFIVQELFRMNHSTLQFGNTAFAFLPSALIAIAWGADSDPKASKEIDSQKGMMNKLSAQLKYARKYWLEDLPNNIKQLPSKLPQLIREAHKKPLERIGRTDKHFIMFHSLASFIATAFLLVGMLFNKNETPFPEHAQFEHKTEQVNQNLEGSNILTKLGWFIGQLGMAPLILFTLLNGFNKHTRQTYGRFGSWVPITAIAYGLTTLASIIFKPFAHIAIFTDFLRHIASSSFGHLKRRGQLANQGI